VRTAAAEAQRDPDAVAGAARWIVERLAVALQAGLLVRYSTPAVADAYLATRVRGGGGATFGTLPTLRAASADIVSRAQRS
jgi:putative acyl-CoA dehydrogenase